MNLNKILDLAKGRKSVSCSANILTLDDARNEYKDYQYAVVNALDNIPVWVCKTLDEAKKTVELWQPYCSVPLLIVDL